jgi:hypothetical protein
MTLARNPEAKGKQKRRHLRFRPGPTTMALLNFSKGGQATWGRRFEGEHVGLVESESIVGCGVVLISDHPPAPETKLWIRVGEIDPLPAVIRWVKEIAESVYQLGIEYSDGAFQK